jgi:predicted kinase
MEAIIFCGIQATGKSTFYKERFFKTHVRISMDLLNTRNKEEKFIDTCLLVHQAFVIDNTNPSKEDRAGYISKAKAHKYKVIGYYFQSKINDALARNSLREGKENIPEVGIKNTRNRLEFPTKAEGFDELYYVEIENNTFKVKIWDNEV